MRRLFLSLVAVVTSAGLAAAQTPIPPDLKNYVEMKDDSFTWKVKAKTESDAGTLYEIDLVSQTWHDVKWDHGMLIALPKKAKLDGVSLLPLIMGKTDHALHEDLFWRVGKKNALRHGDWKIIRNAGGAWQLYDLAKDLSETHDLAAEHLDKVQELETTWERWSGEQAPPAWGGPVRKAR